MNQGSGFYAFAGQFMSPEKSAHKMVIPFATWHLNFEALKKKNGTRVPPKKSRDWWCFGCDFVWISIFDLAGGYPTGRGVGTISQRMETNLVGAEGGLAGMLGIHI